MELLSAQCNSVWVNLVEYLWWRVVLSSKIAQYSHFRAQNLEFIFTQNCYQKQFSQFLLALDNFGCNQYTQWVIKTRWDTTRFILTSEIRIIWNLLLSYPLYQLIQIRNNPSFPVLSSKHIFSMITITVISHKKILCFIRKGHLRWFNIDWCLRIKNHFKPSSFSP